MDLDRQKVGIEQIYCQIDIHIIKKTKQVLLSKFI